MSISRARRLAGAIAILLLTVTLSGCAAMFGRSGSGADPAAVSSPAIAVKATPTPAPQPSDCLNRTSNDGYDAPSSIADFYALHAGAIVGMFGAKGKAHWNTTDQSRPQDVKTSNAIPLTPVTLTDGQVVAGNPNGNRVIMVGGTVGCDTVTLQSVESISLIPGQKYVFIVFPLTDEAGNPTGDWSLVAAWPMGDNGLVTTAVDGDLTVGDIKSGLNNGRPEVTPPTLPEPSGPG